MAVPVKCLCSPSEVIYCVECGSNICETCHPDDVMCQVCETCRGVICWDCVELFDDDLATCKSCAKEMGL